MMNKPKRIEPLYKTVWRNKVFYSMLAPFLILFIFFMFVPVISSIVLSFTDFNMVQVPNFIGVSNYVRLLIADDVFMTALKNTVVFAVITGPVGYILSFIVAWLINETGRRLRGIMTLIIYSPVLAGNAYTIWMFIFASDRRGFLNNILIQMGFLTQPLSWLSDVQYNFMCVLIVAVWMSFGAGFLAFIAGLQSLDRSLFEAAAIDGMTNRWQELYYITFPQMGPQLMFGAVMTISGAFAIGDQCAQLTGFPSTDYSTHTILLHLRDFGTVRFEMGYASAIAVVLFVLMLGSWFLIRKILSRFMP